MSAGLRDLLFIRCVDVAIFNVGDIGWCGYLTDISSFRVLRTSARTSCV